MLRGTHLEETYDYSDFKVESRKPRTNLWQTLAIISISFIVTFPSFVTLVGPEASARVCADEHYYAKPTEMATINEMLRQTHLPKYHTTTRGHNHAKNSTY